MQQQRQNRKQQKKPTKSNNNQKKHKSSKNNQTNSFHSPFTDLLQHDRRIFGIDRALDVLDSGVFRFHRLPRRRHHLGSSCPQIRRHGQNRSHHRLAPACLPVWMYVCMTVVRDFVCWSSVDLILESVRVLGFVCGKSAYESCTHFECDARHWLGILIHHSAFLLVSWRRLLKSSVLLRLFDRKLRSRGDIHWRLHHNRRRALPGQHARLSCRGLYLPHSKHRGKHGNVHSTSQVLKHW